MVVISVNHVTVVPKGGHNVITDLVSRQVVLFNELCRIVFWSLLRKVRSCVIRKHNQMNLVPPFSRREMHNGRKKEFA